MLVSLGKAYSRADVHHEELFDALMPAYQIYFPKLKNDALIDIVDMYARQHELRLATLTEQQMKDPKAVRPSLFHYDLMNELSVELSPRLRKRLPVSQRRFTPAQIARLASALQRLNIFDESLVAPLAERIRDDVRRTYTPAQRRAVVSMVTAFNYKLPARRRNAMRVIQDPVDAYVEDDYLTSSPTTPE